MKVKLKCSGILRKYFPDQLLYLEKDLPEGITIDEILQQMGIPSNAVSAVSINGKLVKGTYKPCDGDEVTILPIISGG